MSNLILSSNREHTKECVDWCPLKDGTMTGDPKYCDFSVECRQTDAVGKGYASDWYKYRDIATGEERFDYFCTGMYPKDGDKGVDKEVT